MDAAKKYAGFIGTWVLDPRSCQYQQGDPPTAATYTIAERADTLEFTIDWTDAQGARHAVSFAGIPDGSIQPFDGGQLADALSIDAESERELNSSAFWQGKRQMIAQRQLDETGSAMRVTQVVYFEDGSKLANVAIYIKRVLN